MKVVAPIHGYNKTLECVPDKSITHRAIMFNALANGRSVVTNALIADDCLATVNCVNSLGAKATVNGTEITIDGAPFSSANLDCKNSGTTMRLMTGLLSGMNGTFTLSGDSSLSSRPMKRVTEPLALMGARIKTTDGKAPLTVTGSALNAIDYDMPIASAQVKSAILLAGLNANGVTTVTEAVKSRDHTERMLQCMGAKIKVDGNKISIERSTLSPLSLRVSGDISAAAFPLCLAAMRPGFEVTVKNVGINPTRSGLITVLQNAGANITIDEKEGFEPVADITVKYAPLKPIVIEKEIVPSLIDEIPALCALACFIDGESKITGAAELKVKECNRIVAMTENLKAMGADITALEDGFIIRPSKLNRADVKTYGDHRIAMALAIAGAAAEGVTLDDGDVVSISYPSFFNEVI